MEKWRYELIEALKRGNLEPIQAEFSAGRLDLNGTTEDDLPVIMLAVYYGQREIVQWFLGHGMRLDGFSAAALGDLHALIQWLNLQANPAAALRSLSIDGWSMLHLAAFFGHDEVVHWLIEQRAPLNQLAQNNQANQPLHAAIASRHGQIAMDLVHAGADVNFDANGFTPLMLACANEMTLVVEFLLANGADPVYRSESGVTAWDLAERHEHDDIRRLLVEKGAGAH